MADVITGNTELGLTKQELIAALVQRELEFNAKLLPYFTNVSAYAQPGMKAISFPKLTGFTVEERVEGAVGSAQALTATVDKLDLNINAYIAWIIDAQTALQSNINAEMEYAKKAAAAHGRFVDSKIITLLGTAAASFENVGADADVAYDDLVEMQKKYLDAEGMVEEGAWLISHAQNKAMISLTEFKDVSAFGEMVIRDGYVKQLLGMPVVVHSGLAAKQLFLAGKEAIAVGFQKSPSMGEQPELQYGVGAKRVAIDQLFGLKAMQTGLKGAAAGKSPLILGLND
jgi:hypothetical protein